jgi:chorismate-pyruvate lyase
VRDIRPARSKHDSTRGFLYPLDVAYARLGLSVPVARRIAPDRIPSPYRTLLAHEGEMTRMLERHFGEPLVIRVLTRWSHGRWYFRRSLLARVRSGAPVAMGMIRLRLDIFSPRLRARVVRGDAPLGRLLRNERFEYRSEPRAFFEITPNVEMLGVFWMPRSRLLYGRQTALTVGGATIGTIIEVLRRVC